MSPLLRRRRTPEGDGAEPLARDGDAAPRPSDGEATTELWAAGAGGAPAELDTGAAPVAGPTEFRPGPPAAPPAPQAPAGVDPGDEIGPRPDTRRRGRLRRRLRHLRRVRELMLRDVGGLVYEIHRAENDSAAEGHQTELVSGKLDRLVALDAERRQLEDTLGDRRDETVLREPGVGGTCPSCGEYFASDAHYCARCGVRVDGHADATPDAVAAAGETAPEPAEGER